MSRTSTKPNPLFKKMASILESIVYVLAVVALVDGTVPPYETKYYEQYVDNFNFRNGDTFQMRYLQSGKFVLA